MFRPISLYMCCMGIAIFVKLSLAYGIYEDVYNLIKVRQAMDNLKENSESKEDLKTTEIKPFCLLALATNIIGLTFATVLCYGIAERKPTALLAWILFMMMWLLSSAVRIMVMFFKLHGVKDKMVTANILYFAIIAVLYAICMVVVNIFRTRILKECGNDNEFLVSTEEREVI